MEEKKVVLTVGGVEIDVTNIPPLTVGDRKVLKQAGVTLEELLKDVGPDAEATLVLHFLKKIRPATTVEEVDSLPAITSTRLFNYILDKSLDVDDPFSMRSTSLPQSMDGASANS